MQFNAIAPVFQAMIEYPYEEAGVCRSPSHTFNFGQDAYQIEYLSDMSNLLPESPTDDETSWTGGALKAAALSTVAISLFKVTKALSNRYFESKGSMSPELPRDIHVLTAKYLSTKDLLAMRLVSAELKAVADMELIDRLNNGSLFLNHLRLYSLSSLIDFFGDRAKFITRIRVQYPQHVDPAFDITRLGQVSLPSLIDFCGGVAKRIVGNHNPECVDQQFDTTLLDRFPKLTHLSLEDFKLNTDLRSLKHCPHLTHLSLEDRNLIADLSFLQYCPNLTRLDLRGCYRIVDLGFFEFCKNLTYLNLGGSYQLTDFSFLEHFPNLTHLDLTDCERISDLSFLQS
ncbi:F-box/LRR-repeat protein [Estrella lausannensis]|uniref:F-box domain-containing protein n=1 Tax=Estrella lausannensis TaxID=483423 RepID=A0A0H5DND6_9BACT|nr:leucine-rich repeat domain-containing protein [Estrella lausannensis]CRX37692.1 hypothetical protein ELAC_0331 [Estrella lausannensis]